MQCSRLPNRNGVTLSDSLHQPLLARSLVLPYSGPCASSVLRQACVVAVFNVNVASTYPTLPRSTVCIPWSVYSVTATVAGVTDIHVPAR